MTPVVDSPSEELEVVAAVEGMPDPTAVKAEEPAKAAKPAKAEKRAKKERPKRERAPRAGASEKGSVLAGVTEASPYTVLLAIALAAVLVAIFYMVLQFATYWFDYQAKEAKQQAAAMSARFAEMGDSRVA